MNDRKKAALSVYFDDAERAAIKAKARSLGLKEGTWIRMLAIQEIGEADKRRSARRRERAVAV